MARRHDRAVTPSFRARSVGARRATLAVFVTAAVTSSCGAGDGSPGSSASSPVVGSAPGSAEVADSTVLSSADTSSATASIPLDTARVPETSSSSTPAIVDAVSISTSVADCDRAEERAGALLSSGVTPAPSGAAAPTPRQPAVVLEEFPHDPAAFTQGLAISQGVMYEGLGRYGASEVRIVDLATGDVQARRGIPAEQFGEGIAIAGGRVVQLTWCSGVRHVYAADTLEPLATFDYPAEGWGLTFDGSRLIASDGSSTLWLLDSDTLSPIGSIDVTDEGRPVERLNELEWVDGRILANIWTSPDIAVIDPATGVVERWIDTAGLRPQTAVDPDAVANGIAWDADRRALYVTGKWWDTLYRIAWP